jgi:hypothetical protein
MFFEEKQWRDYTEAGNKLHNENPDNLFSSWSTARGI